MQRRRGVELRKVRPPKPAAAEGYLWCGHCRQFRDEDEFGWDPSRDQPKRTCRPCHAERMRIYNAANRERVNLDRRLRKRGITRDEFARLVAEQQGLCSICRRERKLDIDHDHKGGHVRALLCGPCNRALGFFDDDPALLEAALVFLRTH